jgi:hypothetical protein
VRLLLDECVPKRLRQDLSKHDVWTVPEMGWAGKENGELLGLAESLFDVFVTVDQKLKYQQSVSGRAIAVVVLVAKRTKIEFLRPLVPKLEQALSEVKPGELREIAV